jgi:hypothetical protein
VLAEDAIKAALKDYKLKQEKLRGEEAVAQWSIHKHNAFIDTSAMDCITQYVLCAHSTSLGVAFVISCIGEQHWSTPFALYVINIINLCWLYNNTSTGNVA